jgi:hypothetical protein
MRAISADLAHVFFHVDRSILSLVWALLMRPGTVALDYVRGRRRRYFGPFAFLFVVVAGESAVIAYTGFHAVATDNPNPVADFLQNHINWVMFAEVPLLALFTRVLNAGGSFNFAEHLVLAAYTSSMRFLFFTVFVVPTWYLFRPSEPAAGHLYYAYLAAWPLYFGFASAQFFQGRRLLSWCKGVVATILTWATTQGLAILVTTAVFLRK